MATKLLNYVEFSTFIVLLYIYYCKYILYSLFTNFYAYVKYIFYTPKTILYIRLSEMHFIMIQVQKKHFGQNIRDMRILKGMKQEALGKVMGMAQQNISKMEQNELPTEEIMERAAKAMGTTVEAIKDFDKKDGLNFFFGATPIQHNYPIKEVIAYFKEELLKEHEEKKEAFAEVETLKAEIETLKAQLSEKVQIEPEAKTTKLKVNEG